MRFHVVSASAATPRAVVALSAFFFLQSVAAAATYVGTPSNYHSLVSKLRPGDTLVLEPGRYGRGLSLHNLNGTAESTIVIKGSRSAPAIRVVRMFSRFDPSGGLAVEFGKFQATAAYFV